LKQTHLDGITHHLDSLNPENVLRRGYAMIQRKTGEFLTSARRAATGEELTVLMHDGQFNVTVEEANGKGAIDEL
jgi:exodeoxyribonuclease VII large subunit